MTSHLLSNPRLAGSTLTARLSADGATLTMPGGSATATPMLLYRISK